MPSKQQPSSTYVLGAGSDEPCSLKRGPNREVGRPVGSRDTKRHRSEAPSDRDARDNHLERHRRRHASSREPPARCSHHRDSSRERRSDRHASLGGDHVSSRAHKHQDRHRESASRRDSRDRDDRESSRHSKHSEGRRDKEGYRGGSDQDRRDASRERRRRCEHHERDRRSDHGHSSGRSEHSQRDRHGNRPAAPAATSKDYSKLIPGYDSMTPAEKLKARTKAALQQADRNSRRSARDAGERWKVVALLWLSDANCVLTMESILQDLLLLQG